MAGRGPQRMLGNRGAAVYSSFLSDQLTTEGKTAVTPHRSEESQAHHSTFNQYLRPKEKRDDQQKPKGRRRHLRDVSSAKVTSCYLLPACKPPEMVFSTL